MRPPPPAPTTPARRCCDRAGWRWCCSPAGQGTRLGFDGPKGDFPFAPITGRTLFAHHAAKVAALRARYGAELPWYVMTSVQNDAATQASFRAADWFGLTPDSVSFFVQGTLPAVDRETGEILLEAPDRLALSPDGHGGLLAALRRAGLVDRMRAEGLTTVYTFQVDNPLVRVARPTLLGYHALARAEMSSVVVRKVGPAERMGVFARVGGRTALVEYSDLPDDLAERREPDGSLTFWAGSRRPLPRARPGRPADRRRRRPGFPTTGPTSGCPTSTPRAPGRAAGAQRGQVRDLRLRRAAPGRAHRHRRGGTGGRVLADQERPGRRLAGHRRVATSTASTPAGSRPPACGCPAPPAGEPAVDLEVDPRLALDADELRTRLPAGLREIDGPTALGFDGPA